MVFLLLFTDHANLIMICNLLSDAATYTNKHWFKKKKILCGDNEMKIVVQQL